MKKIIPLLLLALAFTGKTYTQDGSQLKFGVFVQPSATWLSPQSRDIESAGSTFGFSGGLIMENYFQDNYAISTGLGIGSQGGRLKYGIPSGVHVYDQIDSVPAGTTISYKANYITVPLGLKLKTNQIGYITYFADLGFTFQFNYSAKAESDGDIYDLEKNREAYKLSGTESVMKEFSLFNVGYHFGGGIEYGISEDTALLFGVTYHNGFTDATESTARVLSRVLAFRVGVMF